jgi:hypothetical protein
MRPVLVPPSGRRGHPREYDGLDLMCGRHFSTGKTARLGFYELSVRMICGVNAIGVRLASESQQRSSCGNLRVQCLSRHRD